MRHNVLFALFAGLLTVPVASPTATSAQSTEEQAVLAAVQAMFDAMAGLDSDAFLETILPDGYFLAVGDDTSHRTSPGEFAKLLVGAPRPIFERIWDPEVRISQSIATVWAPYDVYRGPEFSHCGTDAFQLLKTPDGWKVAMVSYTATRPPDCESHPEGPPGGG